MPANKVRRRGPFAPLSAHYYKDDAIMRAGEKAEVLFTRGLAFQSEVIRDGLITDVQLDLLGVGLTGLRNRAKKLCEVGVWERVDGGYNITAWLGWNQSRADIMEAAERDARRKTPRSGDRPPEPDPDGPPPESERNGDRNPNGNHNGFRAESESLAGAAAHPAARASSRSSSTSTSRSPGSWPGEERESRPRGHEHRAAVAATAHSPAAHRLIGAYAATCTRRPPHQVLTDLAVQVDSLLEESWPETDIGRALDAWGAKGLHPRSLPSVAHEVVNGAASRPARPRASTADAAVAAAEALRTGTDAPALRALPGGQP